MRGSFTRPEPISGACLQTRRIPSTRDISASGTFAPHLERSLEGIRGTPKHSAGFTELPTWLRMARERVSSTPHPSPAPLRTGLTYRSILSHRFRRELQPTGNKRSKRCRQIGETKNQVEDQEAGPEAIDPWELERKRCDKYVCRNALYAYMRMSLWDYLTWY